MDNSMIEERMMRIGIEARGVDCSDRDKLRKIAVESLKEDAQLRAEHILKLNSANQPFKKQLELDAAPNATYFYFYRQVGKRRELVRIKRDGCDHSEFEFRDTGTFPWLK